MNIIVTIFQFVLAGMFLMLGMMKLMKTKEQVGMKVGWVNDFSQGQIRKIAMLEVLAAIGLIVPHYTGIYPILTPLAATGIVLLMFGAMRVHRRRGEPHMVAMNFMILIMAAYVAFGRFM